jgi:thymidylate synthase ThyX
VRTPAREAAEDSNVSASSTDNPSRDDASAGKTVDVDVFTPAEREALAPYFTNLDGSVFALVNLPEVVKGALFARYSRSPKSLRRLFLDEFLEQITASSPHAGSDTGMGTERADKLFQKVFVEYGDDSVAQLGGVHLACENVSNIMTKVLEWGRLMAYLEQSTRYVPYTDRPGGKWKYHIPAELQGTMLSDAYVDCMDGLFATYARWIPRMEEHFKGRYPREDGVSKGVYNRTIRAKALDTLRGLLPAAVSANVGIFGTGQAYEALLLRLRAHPLAEARAYADTMLEELRKVIPAFLTRVDQENRGVMWSRYLSETRDGARRVAREMLGEIRPEDAAEVTLTEFDPEGEVRVVASALYASSNLPDEQLLEVARAMSAGERARVLAAYVGERRNRRHKPGRAFERTSYRFDILGDYGAFRDLQRHRMLTLEWQPLCPDHGYVVAEAVQEAGAMDDWKRAMESSAELFGRLKAAGFDHVASYAVPMAYRVRFYMDMNAREAMHTIELRTAPAGHPSYRRVCQEMHRLIGEHAGHKAIADSMIFTDHGDVELERLQAERAAEKRRQST